MTEEVTKTAPPHKQLFAALSKAQGQMENAKKDTSNPFFKSKYADLAGVWDAIRGPLSTNGLAVIQVPSGATAGGITLRTVLTHSSGEALEESFTMPLKANATPQDVGSAITYARRYALMALVGIAPEDDDGNAASAKSVAAKAKAPEVDWAAEAAKVIHQFNGLTHISGGSPDERTLYAEVRNSNMPEPHKTSALTHMANVIKKGTE